MGLTQWLALQAGFGRAEAEAIATGNQRVDSGDIQFIELLGAYACPGKDPESSSAIQMHHFPSATKVPASPAERAVVAGGEAAMRDVNAMAKLPADKASYALYKLGEAIHTLQDSWAHQGTPDIPQPLAGVLACDPGLAWASPAARGGWNSHKADLTWPWPADIQAMASASYQALIRYPRIAGVVRVAKPWDELRPMVDAFAAADTKAKKRKWFVEHGIQDVSFLAGTSVPDGPQPFDDVWKGNRLPLLATTQSAQHHVDPGLLDFFNRFFVQWVASDDFRATAARFGGQDDAGPASAVKGTARGRAAETAELAARLAVWRVRDHGSVADLAHALRPFNGRQLATLDAVGRKPGAYAHYPTPALAFLPILPKTIEASPLVPFLIIALPPTPAGNARAFAAVRFQHLPYDGVQVLAEQRQGRWRLVSIGAVVEH
jgi:hypothetical protein